MPAGDTALMNHIRPTGRMPTWRRVRTDGSIDLLVATSRRELTTSTVVVADGRALMIDPAWEPDELADLAAGLVGAGIEVVVGFATHAHHDHLLWHPGFGSVSRFASLRGGRRLCTAASGTRGPTRPELAGGPDRPGGAGCRPTAARRSTGRGRRCGCSPTTPIRPATPRSGCRRTAC